MSSINDQEVLVAMEVDDHAGPAVDSQDNKEPVISENVDYDIETPDIPHKYSDYKEYIVRQKESMKHLTIKVKKGSIGPVEEEKLKNLRIFLTWLENSGVQMSPKLKTETALDSVLKIIFEEKFKYPESYATAAKRIYDQWEADKWGADSPEESSESDEESSENTNATPATAAPAARRLPVINRNGGAPTLRQPPTDHPIFGQNGIMHGVLIRNGTKKTHLLNIRYKKREARVIGSNGLQVGAWFPYQISAIFHGAHGERMAGICGTEESGAYSVVIAGTYDDLDTDQGDLVYYSGSKAHTNKNPDFPEESSRGTRALKTSLRTGHPVRVLRSAFKKSVHAPPCGIRYDGLYQVTEIREPINRVGGKYEQFVLERLPNQPSLYQAQQRPTLQERSDYEQIQYGY